jgi:hypothetical protein
MKEKSQLDKEGKETTVGNLTTGTPEEKSNHVLEPATESQYHVIHAGSTVPLCRCGYAPTSFIRLLDQHTK